LIIDPNTDASSWDNVIIADRAMPCLTEYPDADAGRKLDAKSAPGSSGGVVRDLGYDLANVTFTLFMWESDHFRRLNELLSSVFPRAGKRRDAVRVYHPVLEPLRIEYVVIQSISAIKRVQAQLFKCVLKSIEHNPPPRTTSVIQTPQAPPVLAIVETQTNGSLGPGLVVPAAPASPRTRSRST
jgi:hypothetical protein